MPDTIQHLVLAVLIAALWWLLTSHPDLSPKVRRAAGVATIILFTIWMLYHVFPTLF